MIEQATKLMSAVHKRLHQAQGQEFDMLKSMLMEDPSALWRHNKKSKVLEILVAEAGQQPLVDAEKQAEARHREMFLAALADCELVPAADPNTSSQTERYLKVVAMRQMAQTNQNIDLDAVDKRAFQVMGIDDGDSFFKPPPAPGAAAPPNPEEVTAQATMIAAQARLTDSQTKAKTAQQNAANAQQEFQNKKDLKALDMSKEIVIHQSDQTKATQDQQAQATQRAADRVHKLSLATAANRHSAGVAAADRTHEAQQSGLDRAHEAHQNNLGIAHKIVAAHADRTHDAMQGGIDRVHQANQNALDRSADSDMTPDLGLGVAP